MRSIVYRLLSFLVALLFSISLIASALAVDDGDNGSEYVQKSSFVQWAGSIIQDWIGFSFGAACPESEDGYHHSSSTLGHPVDIFGQESPYYECICTYCGATFTAYETDLQQSYDNQVADLPATSYSSDGSLLFPVSFFGFRIVYASGATGYFDFLNPDDNLYQVGAVSARFLPFANTVRLSLRDGYSSFTFSNIGSTGILMAPYDGYYQRISSPSISVHYVFSDGQTFDESKSYTADASPLYFSAGAEVYRTLNNSYSYLSNFTGSGKTNLFFLEGVFYPAYYKFTPAPSVDLNFNATYNINTRPTSITGGNYGIIGDNGQITQVTDNSTIVNETNNTYYNPATGETSTITDWSYDYSDRSYNLTLEGGDTSTVTYGDENIIIVEATVNESGDTIINNYTIYYIIDGSGTGTGPENPPAVCTHNWQETRAVPATCTRPGSASYVCSLCNQTKTETIPALGHNWQVKQTVTTQYDDTGQLVQQGYTIFECSVCHEQYKSQDGAVPPGGSGSNSGDEGEEKEGFLSWLLRKAGELLGAVGNGIIGFLQSVLDGIFDGLISLVNSVFENLAQLVDLFGSFGDALGVLWTWLPPEIMVILVAGVSVFVLIALLKLFIK